jgi:hypothetical protein
MEISNEDIVSEKSTKELVMAALQFCTFIENVHTYEQWQITDYLSLMLPLLYIKGSLLPDTEIEDNASCEQFLTEEQCASRYLALQERTEEIEFFESYNWTLNEIETYSLCEMVVDIYQALKNFLLLYNKGTFAARESSLFMLRYHFTACWGDQSSILIPYLHYLSYPVAEELD